MSFLFVSHASEDKPKVKSIVKSLALLGTQVWVDRPGKGENSMDLPHDFIVTYGIKGLQSGIPWDEQLRVALKESGAVLGCLSRNIKSNRVIIDNELVFASVSGKLAACIIDDLPYGEIEEFGLARINSVQANRVNCNLLNVANDLFQTSQPIEEWPENARIEWRIVERLKYDIDQILIDRGLWLPSESALKDAETRIAKVPIGPPIAPEDLSFELVDKFAEAFDTSQAALRHIQTAMDLLWKVNGNEFTRDQILVRRAELPNLDQVGAQSFWTDVFLLANHKSRRTLAALVLTPGRNLPQTKYPLPASKLHSFVSSLIEVGEWSSE